MSNKKLDSKKKNKELVEQAAERLAEIFIMQIEMNKKQKIKNDFRRKTKKIQKNL